MHGVVVVDKPEGPTSRSCLNAIKKHLGQKKIGHAGTLDPMATGVLPVLLGAGTKLAPYIMGGDKTYFGELRLGLTTDTYDIHGKVIEERPWEQVAPDDAGTGVTSWTGLTEQEVPPVSAAKHKGKPLYELARAGRETPVKVKAIEVKYAEVVDIDLPQVRFRVAVSAGTYIRSLVHSLGMRLGPGAVLTALTRERSGPFGLDGAFALDDLLEEPRRFPERVLSIREALGDWPRLILEKTQARLVENGAWLPVTETAMPEASEGSRALAETPDEEPLALVEARQRDERLRWAILRGL
jgi:tRNA pseudouridine55 synthase